MWNGVKLSCNVSRFLFNDLNYLKHKKKTKNGVLLIRQQSFAQGL